MMQMPNSYIYIHTWQTLTKGGGWAPNTPTSPVYATDGDPQKVRLVEYLYMLNKKVTTNVLPFFMFSGIFIQYNLRLTVVLTFHCFQLRKSSSSTKYILSMEFMAEYFLSYFGLSFNTSKNNVIDLI